MNEIRITVPFDPGRLAPNKRLHWAERAREARTFRIQALLCWHRAGEPRALAPVSLSAVIRRGRTLDADAAVACLKHGIDGLCNDAITPHDGPAWVSLGTVTQETGKRWKGREEVEFVIVPREETR